MNIFAGLLFVAVTIFFVWSAVSFVVFLVRRHKAKHKPAAEGTNAEEGGK